MVYTVLMSSHAKVFMNGRSQAIRLPKEFRVKGDEVIVRRVAEGILITERDPWEICEDACGELSDSLFDALDRRRENLQLESRDWSDDD